MPHSLDNSYLLVTVPVGSQFTWHGGRQRSEILGIRSSVRQRSARSSPPRRRSVHLQCPWPCSSVL